MCLSLLLFCDDFVLPSPPSEDIDEDDKRPHPLPLSPHPPPFQPSQQPIILTPRQIGQMAAEATVGEQVFEKKVKSNIAEMFPGPDDILNQKEESFLGWGTYFSGNF